MQFLKGIIGILFGFALIKWREPLGAMIGDPAWAGKVGGIYNLLIIVGVLIFFWSLATMTGTTEILFAPIFMFLPHKAAPMQGTF